MHPRCSKCDRETLPDKVLGIKTENNVYYYCKPCIQEAANTLSMKIFKNKEERSLLKKMRKFLKGKNYGKN